MLDQVETPDARRMPDGEEKSIEIEAVTGARGWKKWSRDGSFGDSFSAFHLRWASYERKIKKNST